MFSFAHYPRALILSPRSGSWIPHTGFLPRVVILPEPMSSHLRPLPACPCPHVLKSPNLWSKRSDFLLLLASEDVSIHVPTAITYRAFFSFQKEFEGNGDSFLYPGDWSRSHRNINWNIMLYLLFLAPIEEAPKCDNITFCLYTWHFAVVTIFYVVSAMFSDKNTQKWNLHRVLWSLYCA